MTRSARAGALALLLLLALPAGASAATSPCTAKLSTARPTLGAKVTVSGTVRPKVRRTVVLQRKSGRKWVQVARTRSSRTGTYRLTVPTKVLGKASIRVVAPRSGRRRALTCRALSLTVAPRVVPPVAPPTAPAAAPTATPAPPPAAARPMPPAPPAKPSFRAIYALAADQAEDPNHPAAIVATIDAVNAWYATQTTGSVQPRWVRAGGVPRVDVVRLPRTAAEYAAGEHAAVRADLETVWPAGMTERDLVWMDVSASSYCGVTVNGAETWVYFPEKACDIHPKTPTAWPGDMTYLVGHELAHALGAHLHTTQTDDLLYQGPGPRDWGNLKLDPGHDDYYGLGGPDDIASSPFWTATSDPAS